MTKGKYLAVALLVLFACEVQDDRGITEPTELGSTIRAVVTTKAAADAITTVTVQMNAKDFEVGAFQGRFVFDPRALEFVDAAMPDDGYRVFNPNEAEDGMIRYAGFSVDGFKVHTAIVLTFRVREPHGLDDIGVSLDVVGSVEGVAVPARRILPPVGAHAIH